jgi:DNA-binding NtrC family response regulator
MEKREPKTVFVLVRDIMYKAELCHTLEQDGYQVRAFDSPESCLVNLISSPDLIIIENTLGQETTGLHYLNRIKAFVPAMPVFLIIAPQDYKTGIDALMAGAYCYIEKDEHFHDAIKSNLHEIDLFKKRKFASFLRAVRRKIFSLYNMHE